MAMGDKASDQETVDPLKVERDLRDRLAGRRLVAEIGIDPDLYRDSTRALQQVLGYSVNRHPERLAKTYPATTVTYLVAHGVYQYQAGEFWWHQAVHHMDRALGGPAFERAIRGLGLETFENLLGAEKAMRFITPILAHGGIPNYCLQDYFDLLLKDLGEGSADATDLLTIWRTRKTRFQNIDRPVQRFLLHGGELAVDLIDRCVDLVREHSRTGTVLSPEDAGLPSYVVRAFARREDKRPKGRRRPATTSGRPTIELDPWSAQGPVMTLPAVDQSVRHAAWHLTGDQRRRVDAGSEATRVPLNPAPAWSVELASLDLGVLRQSSFEGLDPVPALFFDPDTGRLVSSAGGLRLRSVWTLAPAGTAFAPQSGSASSSELQEPESLPEPTGTWSGYSVRHFKLEGITALHVTPPGSSDAHAVRVLAVAERPTLVVAPLNGVATDRGLAVLAFSPAVQLPSSAVERLDQWRVRIAIRDEESMPAVSRPADEVADAHGVVDLSAVTRIEPLSAVDLVVQGPLGCDLRTSFAVVPGLAITRPERLLFPGDKTSGIGVKAERGITIDGRPGDEVQRLPVPERVDGLDLQLATASRSTTITLKVPRLLWGVSTVDDPVTHVNADVVVVRADDVTDGRVSALVVQTGEAGHPLRLILEGRDHHQLQQSDKVTASGREGRWVFDLARFRDTIALSEDSSLDLVLFVGSRPVTAARIRASLDIGPIRLTSRCVDTFTSVRLEYDEPRAVRDRVLRLWSRDRPWAEPVSAPIPDEQIGFAEITGYDTIPPGDYRAELAIDDGWGSPKRPTRGSPHTAEVTIGSHGDHQAYLQSLNPDDPVSVLELAGSTGRIARHLDETELMKIGPLALTAALHAIADDRGRDASSPQFAAITSLLTADEACFARTLANAVTDGRCTPQAATRLTLQMLDRVHPPELRTAIGGELRALWQTCPLAAIRFELTPTLSGEQASRLEEFLGWAPDADEPVPTGRPVTQQYVGIGADVLTSIQASIELIPRRVLDLDSLVAANFEWLLAEKRGEADVSRWWHEAVRVTSRLLDPAANLRAHLEQREPPRGTVAWAGIPEQTLGLSTLVVRDDPCRPEAVGLLADAFHWAPKLVSRDLVLACLLQWLDDQEGAA